MNADDDDDYDDDDDGDGYAEGDEDENDDDGTGEDNDDDDYDGDDGDDDDDDADDDDDNDDGDDDYALPHASLRPSQCYAHAPHYTTPHARAPHAQRPDDWYHAAPVVAFRNFSNYFQIEKTNHAARASSGRCHLRRRAVPTPRGPRPQMPRWLCMRTPREPPNRAPAP